MNKNYYDFKNDVIYYKNYKIEKFFEKFPQQDYMKKYVKDNLMLLCIGGSNAYGLNTESSDLDIRGIFKDDFRKILGDEKFDQLAPSKNDITIYSFSKTIELIAEQNPNMQELLWIDDDDIIYATEEYWKLRNYRVSLLSKLAYDKYNGYAESQLKRMKGHNKWLTKEQSGKFNLKPHIKDYLTFINNNDGYISKGLFFGDHYYFMKVKDEVYNVFRNYSRDITLPLIEKCNNFLPVQEKKINPLLDAYSGVVIFNKQQFKIDLDEYNNWKTWKENRNKERHELEEKYGYDTKHAMHTFRLLLMGNEILKDNIVNVKRNNDREFLLDIKRGKYEYDEIIKKVDELKESMFDAYTNSKLQKRVARSYIVDIIMEFLK